MGLGQRRRFRYDGLPVEGFDQGLATSVQQYLHIGLLLVHGDGHFFHAQILRVTQPQGGELSLG